MANAYVLDAVRTPRGRGKAGKGALSGIHPQELLAQALEGLAERTGIDRADVDDVVVGCVSQAGEQGANIARNAVLAAGWPIEVTGVSAQPLLRLRPPGGQFRRHGRHVRHPGAWSSPAASRACRACRWAPTAAASTAATSSLRERFFQVPQGISADLIATLEGFTREEVDALRSGVAAEGGRGAATRAASSTALIPVRDPETGKRRARATSIRAPDTTPKAWPRSSPSFERWAPRRSGRTARRYDQVALKGYPQVQGIHHVHTAGNSSGIVDGAAAVLLASERVRQGARRSSRAPASAPWRPPAASR